MKRAIAFGVCFCLVAGAYADNAKLVDLTGGQEAPIPPVNNPTGISAAQTVTMHIATVGTSLQYATAILDGDGVDQLYLKVQQQSNDGNFSHIGFYHLEGSSIGGLANPAFQALTAGFSEADFTASHDGAGNLKMSFTNLVPSQPDQVYENSGWIPRGGDQMGIAGFAGIAAMDDFGIEVDGVCDDFNRADGPLGDDWTYITGGTGQITGGRAFVGIGGRGRYTFSGECGGPACNYTLKKSKAKRCEVCPRVGSEVTNGEACEVKKDCTKKVKETIACPDGGNGTCKIKGKRSSCG